MKPSTIFFLTIIAILSAFLFIIHSNLQKTELQRDKVIADLQIQKHQNKELKLLIEKQNSELEKISADYDTSVKELNEWKRKKEEIKYVTIEKIRVVKSDECNETSSVIDAVRGIDFSGLQ